LLIRYSHDILESETSNHIIYNLKAKIYEITLVMLKREMNDPSYVPNLNNLKRDIRQIYTNSKSTTVTTNKSGEMILAAIQPKGKQSLRSNSKVNVVGVVLRATKLLTVGTMIRTKQSVLTIIRREHQIPLLLKPLRRKSSSVIIVIKKVTS
jgi:tRNA(Met) C34 N-acetyltransferase TmcA